MAYPKEIPPRVPITMLTMDDIILLGLAADVADQLHALQPYLLHHGLELAPDKCNVWAPVGPAALCHAPALLPCTSLGMTQRAW
eukprot:408428-Amphidinium_carterae.1